MALCDELIKYRQSVNDAFDIIDFSHSRYQSGGYKYPENIRKFMSRSACIDIFISWESFVEAAFLDFLVGELSVTGRAVTRYVIPIDFDHGRRIATGTNRYIDWGNPEIVRRMASLYFENGEPFSSIIGSINSDLLDLKKIRNAAAHITSTTQTQLDATASRWLSRPFTNIEVYDFIFSVVPNSNPTKTVLRTMVDSLDAAAFSIINC
jgi:hypothetical protein